MGLANVAATNMEHLCNCSAHGYSQGERWGNAERGVCKVECEGHVCTFWKGDRDCSSAVCDAWQEALIGTPFEGALAGASYTGNMRRVFVESGLFEWKPMSFIAQRGDIYLSEANHTAMCVDAGRGAYGYDALAEFSINEKGEIVGGAAGDQTGRESYIHAYYDFPWDGILHYNGKGDGAGVPVEDGPREQAEPQASPEPVAAGGGYRVGDRVGYNRIYGSSDGVTGFEPCYTEGTITRIVEGARNPYLIDGNIGWINDDCIIWFDGKMIDEDPSFGDRLSDADVEALARAVIRGDYGNGAERRERLGDAYAAVQKRVNELLGK